MRLSSNQVLSHEEQIREATRLATPSAHKNDERILVPDDEDFEIWCANPVTRFVASAFKRLSENQKIYWEEISWETGKVSLEKRCELRAKSDAYADFLTLTKEEYARIIERR